jgi:cytochrome P450
MLLPVFSPGRVEALTPMTRSLADGLIDRLVTSDRADAALDYAQHIPVRVIAHMLGIAASDEDLFTTWAARIFKAGDADAVTRSGAQEVSRCTGSPGDRT